MRRGGGSEHPDTSLRNLAIMMSQPPPFEHDDEYRIGPLESCFSCGALLLRLLFCIEGRPAGGRYAAGSAAGSLLPTYHAPHAEADASPLSSPQHQRQRHHHRHDVSCSGSGGSSTTTGLSQRAAASAAASYVPASGGAGAEGRRAATAAAGTSSGDCRSSEWDGEQSGLLPKGARKEGLEEGEDALRAARQAGGDASASGERRDEALAPTSGAGVGGDLSASKPRKAATAAAVGKGGAAAPAAGAGADGGEGCGGGKGGRGEEDDEDDKGEEGGAHRQQQQGGRQGGVPPPSPVDLLLLERLEEARRRVREKLGSALSLADLDSQDVCPTCLDPYTDENPRITTLCSHHFHLACIYEWLERSRTCPVCARRMEFEELL